ncbi:tetratricopeptide repeat protein [candidate division KSB1 bacterium]|nr:tetratricopeptide repeat protein [candidate division KSB1 bacterium]NIS25091.1 tetratricopeptide repeat protein [candidate division KSB1 bacterium]NIT72010.1 tetratricopeptide repeat protein [candidate division KSB1 bacterium]NIU25790.1 tetratricopeptide repeat protein [candidate division KSB1 bacterium]NIU93779.1 tetratricopeptide repeat protein [candidate division KSB1 bacterium]
MKGKPLIKNLALGLLCTGLVSIAFFSIYDHVWSPPDFPELLPKPDLSAVEAQVAQKIEALKAEVEKSPDSAESWGKLAMALDIHDFKHESIPCYQRAIALDPNEFRWTYYYAIVLSETGSPEAFKWFERCSSLNSDYAPLHVIYGEALYEAGQLEKARMAYRRALAINSNSAHAYLGLGKIALSKGDLTRSREYLHKTLEPKPQFREAHGLLAEVYRRLNEPKKANRELKIAQQLPKISPLADPVYDELVKQGVSAFWYRERGLVYQAEGRIDEAIQQFKIALQLRPDPEGHVYVANLLRELNRLDEAADHYRAAINLQPNYIVAYNNLGQLLLEMGQVEEGLMWVEKALRLDRRFPDAYISLGTFYVRKGRDAEAIATYRQGLQVTQGFMPIALRLAWLLATSPQQELRDGKEAMRLAKAICKKTKYHDPESLDVLAAAYAEMGQFSKAVQIAEKAYELASANQEIELAKEIRVRLALFRTQTPYRANSS